MDVITRDVCIVNGFRLTEYQITNGKEIIDTFFNIRDAQGVRQGRNYDDVDEPLKIMLNMCITSEIPPFFA